MMLLLFCRTLSSLRVLPTVPLLPALGQSLGTQFAWTEQCPFLTLTAVVSELHQEPAPITNYSDNWSTWLFEEPAHEP